MSDQTMATTPPRRKRHWFAGIFYLFWAVLGIIAAVSGTPQSLLVTLVAGLYALYLFRGGRFVLFFW